MEATNPSTPTMSSQTFTHGTRCTMPKASPFLSSSFTPFYPRSQQSYLPQSGSLDNNGGDFQVSMQHFDDADAGQSHFPSWPHGRCSKLYDQQYYACSGVPWFPNNGTVWDGCAWQQWGEEGEFVYAEDDTGDSPNFISDSLSYYAGSSALEHDSYLSTAGNSTSIPVPFPEKETKHLNSQANERVEAVPKFSTSITGRSPFSKAFYSTSMPEQASGEKKRDGDLISSSVTPSDQAASGLRQVPAKGRSMEKANEFFRSDFDAKSYSMQISVQTNSEGIVPQKDASKEQASVIVAELKRPTSSPVTGPDANGSMDAAGHVLSTSFHKNSDMLPKTEDRSKNVGQHGGINQITPDSEQCPSMIDAQAHEQMNDADGLHQKQTCSSFSQSDMSGLSFNGRPHLLVECIHNLSKVLFRSQSKASLNALSSSDYVTIEDTICMLSHRLVQSTSETSAHQEPDYQQVAQDPPINCGDTLGSVQKDADQFTNTKHIVSLPMNFRTGHIENTPKRMDGSATEQDDHISSLKQQLELRMLRGEVKTLQEQVAYERAESHVTVSMYKNLWSEAQEALKVSRLEIWKTRSELEAFKEKMAQLKHAGGTLKCLEIANCERSLPPIQGDIHDNFPGIVTRYDIDLKQLSPYLNEPPTKDMVNSCSASLKEAPEVLTGRFDPKMNWKDERVKGISTHDDQAIISTGSGSKIPELTAGGSNSDQATLPSSNLEHDVARRLSLLLSRPGLDLNKAYNESNMEWSSRSGSILEPSTDVQGKDEAMVRVDSDYVVWSETAYLVNGKRGPEYVSRYGHDGCGSLDRGTESKVNQEDEIEIICFKPGVVDMLKGEPEWEDVAVNIINDLTSVKSEMD